MITPLEKAIRDPESTPAKILNAARIVFGQYGFHGTTTRMIAKEAQIDISALHYHWGEKTNLYEAVIQNINRDFRQMHLDIEKAAQGRTMHDRLNIAIDMSVDYLFEHPEISNLILHQYFTKTRQDIDIDIKIPETATKIALAIGLSQDRKSVPVDAHLKVLVLMNSIHQFVSGEQYYRTMLNLERKAYITHVKDTLKYIHIKAFTNNLGTKKETPVKKKSNSRN